MLYLIQQLDFWWDADIWSSQGAWSSVYIAKSHREAKRLLHHFINSRPTLVCEWNGRESLAKGKANAKYWRAVPLKPGAWPDEFESR